MKKYFETTWRLWKLLKPFHKYFYYRIFFIAINQFVSIYSTFLVSKIIDNSVNKSWQLVIIYFIIYFIILMINRLVFYLSGKKEIEYSYGKIQQFLEGFSLRKVLSLNASQYIENHSAIRMQIIDRGESSVQSIIETILLQIFPLILTLVGSLFAIAIYSWQISIITFIVMIIVIIAIYKFNNYWRPLQIKNRENWNKQRKIQVEAYEHLKTIKLFGVENNFIKYFIRNRFEIVKYHIFTQMKRLTFGNIRELFLTITKLFSLALAIYLFYKGNYTIGIVYALFSWVSNSYSQASNVNQILGNLPTNYIYLEQYLELIDMKVSFIEEGKRKFKAGNINFENINFKYPKSEKNILNDLNLEIKEGSKVAFVGYSGSGKTTIIQLLLRSYDYTDGDIKIGEVSLKDMSANNLRQNIGYVEQHVDLFDDTIKNNILFGITNKKLLNKIEKDKSILEDIAKKSRIDQFYHRLDEKGFDTMLGERAVKLSGGERQRVGIARALIKDPAILIFDEATSALDAENEKYIKEAIEEASCGRTTIIIAHRLSTVRDVDEIFMMSHGKVIARGTHTELLNSSPEYKSLVEAQMN